MVLLRSWSTKALLHHRAATAYLQQDPQPGLSAPRDCKLWSRDFGSSYFCILFIFLYSSSWIHSLSLTHPYSIIYVRQTIPPRFSRPLRESEVTPVLKVLPLPFFCSPSEPRPSRVVPGGNLGVISQANGTCLPFNERGAFKQRK